MSTSVAGSGCLFCLLRFSNLLLAAVGLAVTALGIYTTVEAKAFNWYSGSFIIAGCVVFLISLFGYKNRRHPYLVSVYLVLVFAIFVCLVGLTLGIIFYPEYADKVGGNTKAEVVRYCLLGMCVVALTCLMVGCWYRSSLNDAIFEKENEPKEVKKPLVTPKTDKAREAMYKKYPQLKALHEPEA